MGHWQLRAESGGGAVFTCGFQADSRPAAEAVARDMLPPSFLDCPAWLVITQLPAREKAPALAEKAL